MKRPKLVDGEIYHIVLRGVEQRQIFLDEIDYYRGIFSLFEFNNANPVSIKERRKDRSRFKKQIARGQTSDNFERILLVEILAFALMPNHLHLLLRQIKSKGISLFVQKLGTGYASYFNRKYKRSGHLFQGRFHAVHVKTDEQLERVFIYIHTNPVAIIESKWKERGIKNRARAKYFLKNYRWSSYLDYIGKKNFPSVSERKFLLKTIGGEKRCGDLISQQIDYNGSFCDSEKIGLE